jgi:diacylglycerol kinase (ATP)
MTEFMPSVAVIVNPTAGAGKGLRLLPRLVSALQAHRCSHHLHLTTGPGEAIEVARRFACDGATLVLAVGGDGTVNEVANGLLEAGGTTALAVIPAGRGVDFTRSLNVPRNLSATIDQAVAGRYRRVDVGRATFANGTSRIFVNAGGLGFDTTVAEGAMRSRLPGSSLPYISAVLRAIARYRTFEIDLEADGNRIIGHVASAIVANGRYLGGGMKLVPTADLADGLIDLAILGDLTRRELIVSAPRVYRGAHVNHPKFTHRPIRSVHITTGAPVRVQLDGELHGTSPVTFTVEPNALLVVG